MRCFVTGCAGFNPLDEIRVGTEYAIGDVQNLHMTLRVDGQVEQDSSTSKMIFSVNEIVAFLSTWVTLDRGDIISTGLVESPANTVDDIIAEIAAARVTERGSRADDKASEAAMEDRKKAGYF